MMESNLMKRGNLGTVLVYGPIRIIFFTPFELFLIVWSKKAWLIRVRTDKLSMMNFGILPSRITVNDKSPPEDVGRLLVLSHVS
jgi:hypothetical protein